MTEEQPAENSNLTKIPVQKKETGGQQEQAQKPAAASSQASAMPATAKKTSKSPAESGWVAAIRLRGDVNIHYDIKRTLELLRLQRKHVCVVYQNSVSLQGMLRKVKDYVTFGTIDEATLKELVAKRGSLFTDREQDSKGKITYNKFIVIDGKKVRPYFRLNPPRGGFETKGIKKPYTVGGALGKRKDGVDLLVRKML
ncbi:MAG: 50S ribosomal protein L30 [DPANN group archaeon]|nr:50S ribosomal protein L30 [DPANN group archaeon]